MLKKKVLIIDDEKLILKATQLVLNSYGYEVATSVDGEDGLKKARSYSPDVVLLDIMMPGMDGWQTLRRMKSDPQTADIPVIIFTAKEYFRGRELSRQAGAAEYISKPFEAEDLIETIDQILNKNRTEKKAVAMDK